MAKGCSTCGSSTYHEFARACINYLKGEVRIRTAANRKLFKANETLKTELRIAHMPPAVDRSDTPQVLQALEERINVIEATLSRVAAPRPYGARYSD